MPKQTLSFKERKLDLLQRENVELKNRIDLRGTQLINSFSTFAQNLGDPYNSNLNSFSNLSYFMNAAPLTVNYTLLTYLYKTHGIIQKVVGVPVRDALRGGLDITSKQLSTDDIKELADVFEKNGIFTTITNAGIWARLYGGGAIIINTDQDPATPLNLKRIRKFGLYAANRWEVVSQRRFAEYYDFYGIKLHHSRVLTMNGTEAPYIVKWTLQDWGMSELEGLLESFNLYLRTRDVVYELLREAKIDVYKFNNFAAQLASSSAGSKTQNRVQLMNTVKSYLNALVMDKDDEYEQKQIAFTGLAEVMKQNQVFIASESGMPLTKLFGLSAAGFSSGEDDIENYNCKVESEVRDPLRPVIRTILDLVCAVTWGRTYDISFNYKPLRVMSSEQEEKIKTDKNNRYLALYDRGLLSSKETMEIQQMEKLVPIETAVAAGALPEPPVTEGTGGESDGNGGE